MRYSPQAKQDLQDILTYLLPLNKAAAKRVRDSIRHSIAIASAFPAIGRMQD
ncbi:MAG: type II toxin-antitoxin system RelE/ParE family toxin, partial [Methylobacteriaceae bacterium]|nr:type II toxin-antitoxin system RelE/ParE family toxin [Methylobacteriaceae bacterium]